MKYLMFLCSDVSNPDYDVAAGMAGCDDWSEEMHRRGVLLGAEGLRPASDARTVRVHAGETLLSDGPFAETKDQMGGYSLIECADLDEALEVAAKHPWARVGQIEVRPAWQP